MIIFLSLTILGFATIILVVNTARAGYFDSPLANVWNSRKDLQKAFPGDPLNNSKLEAWCKKYGWKDDVSLFGCYPDKIIIEKIIDAKYNDRITSLENKVNELSNKINQLSSASSINNAPIVQNITTAQEGEWRDCRVGGSYRMALDENGDGYGEFESLTCPTSINDKVVNGVSQVKVLFK